MRINPCFRDPRYPSVRRMTGNSNESGNEPNVKERPLFAHPPWTVGIVLVIAVLAILAGFSDPIWFLLGLPCILVLALFIYVRIATRNRVKN
jgi:hypothetical protein